MVTQQFIVPSFLPLVPAASLVELLHFMFFGYNWESYNLVGFHKMLAKYRDLSPFDCNYTMWFNNKFCVSYGAWTFYNKVGIPSPIYWLQCPHSF